MLKGLGEIYLTAAMNIIHAINTESWDEMKKHLSEENFVTECATLTLRGPRGTGHTQFLLKMLKSDKDFVVFTYNEAAKKNLSQGGYTFYNISDEKDVLKALRTSPKIIVCDSIEVGSSNLVRRAKIRINNYIYNALNPVFLILTGR